MHIKPFRPEAPKGFRCLLMVMVCVTTMRGRDHLAHLGERHAAEFQFRGVSRKPGPCGPLRHRLAEKLLDGTFFIFRVGIAVQGYIVVQGNKSQVFQSFQESACLLDRGHIIGDIADEYRRQRCANKIRLLTVSYVETRHRILLSYP